MSRVIRFAAAFVFLLAPVLLCGQQSGSDYVIDVHRINTEHSVKITGTLYVGEEKYKVQTECFSVDKDYPCIVPNLGTTLVQYRQQEGSAFLRWATKPDVYGQQTMHRIVDIEVSQ